MTGLCWKQFFKDGTGQSSMSRLLLFGSFLVSSSVIIKQSATLGAELLGVYIGAFAVSYGAGKFAEREKPPAKTSDE